MDLFIRRPPEFYVLYNCSFYDVDSIPLKLRQNVPLGLAFFMIGIVEWLLYVPCLMAIWKRVDNACYKMMFYMGVLDMACLPVCAIGSGILGMLGAVYCSYPNLLYVMGSVGLMLWVTESSIEILLALNRCVEICSPHAGELLFEGRKTCLWMIPPTLYGVYVAFFTMSASFNSLLFSWFFNPHIGYLDDNGQIYHNHVHTIHNRVIVVMLTGTYLAFALILFAKTRVVRGQLGAQHVSQKMIFLQVALISTVNVIAAVIYVYMQFGQISELLILIAQFAWTQAHGLPPFIYLVMNKTLRRDCVNILLKFFCGMDLQKTMHTTRVGQQSQLTATNNTGTAVFRQKTQTLTIETSPVFET